VCVERERERVRKGVASNEHPHLPPSPCHNLQGGNGPFGYRLSEVEAWLQQHVPDVPPLTDTEEAAIAGSIATATAAAEGMACPRK